MTKRKLIALIEDTIAKIKIEYHNESTYTWSKGFRKGALFILEFIKSVWTDEE